MPAPSPRAVLLAYDEARDRETYRAGLSASLPNIPIAIAATEAEAIEQCQGATILVGLAHHVSQAIVNAMPDLRMIQALTTGTDHLDRLVLPPDITIASARGIHGPQMAEQAFLFMLALSRRFDETLRNQAAAKWLRRPQPTLRGSTVLVFGVGTIAEDLALRCQAFGMRVIGISGGRQSAPHFDSLHPRSAFADVAGQADFLIILAPYSSQTHHAVDAQVLARCKPGAFLINLARGGVVDEAALIDALRHGRLAGAGLDVFAQEPLPPESPLWHMDRVMITPHIGGMSTSYAQDVLGLITHNLQAFAEGRVSALRNVVRAPHT